MKLMKARTHYTMTDKKLTDSEIVKVLECCVTYEFCTVCPLVDNCPSSCSLLKSTLDLINRQKAEIERLEQEKGQFEADVEMFTDIGKMYSELKAEAIKEVFEKLRAEYTERFLVSGDTVIEILNEAEKEMVGEG